MTIKYEYGTIKGIESISEPIYAIDVNTPKVQRS
jgi:hypothetical protein